MWAAVLSVIAWKLCSQHLTAKSIVTISCYKQLLADFQTYPQNLCGSAIKWWPAGIVNFEADTVIFEFMAFHFLHLGHRTAAFTEGALLILVVIVLPIQAVVRYGNLRSKPLSSAQLDGMFIFCIFIAILYGLLTSAAVSPWEPPNLPADAYPQVIVVVQLNAAISRAMTFVCVFLVITTYALIVIYTLKARMLMKTMQRVISNETKRLQARMRKLIIIQTVFPLFCLVTPTFLLGAYPYLDLKNYTHLLNDFCTTCFIWISLFNPLSVIMLMPQYRRKFFRALCWGTSPKSPAATMVTSIAEAQTVRRQ
ncbi:unnamed protein product [Bursaphelenchus xylophilus]|uniref:(pine wood nematode) hypothetical protein n=1 Tax=Bursaphelenchus xylophilus TaxID=6326 RepID=A0A1I7RQR7_BURXY|nr:unnamed protein product [Bursaphelenchus xylophilus]CAG9105012.1 unnamed protein product [Bursaphelenchus xylophilus]